MTRFNQPIVHYCFSCEKWYFAEDMERRPCEECGAVPTWAKCDRCGYEWKMNIGRYPHHCPGCKTPYYNQLRMQDRYLERAKLYYENPKLNERMERRKEIDK